MYRDIVIVSAVRTPFGRYCGSLKEYDYFDLGALPMREVLERVNLPGAAVDEVFWGVGDTSVCKDVYTPVAARQTLLKAGLPPETPSVAIDKACVSAMSAVHLGCRAMAAGEIRAAIGGGATSFSQEPLIVRGLRWKGFRMGAVQMEDPLFALGYKDYNPVSVDTDNVAAEHGVSRQEQDEWALRSHQNYGEAWNAGKYEDELMVLRLHTGAKLLEIDEQYRADITIEKLARMPGIYGCKSVTAGNAPGLNDGAAAILFMTKARAKELGLSPLAQIVSMASIAIGPDRMPEGPAFAAMKAMKLAGIGLEDVEVMEINEAFAAVPLVSMRILSDKEKGKKKKLQKRPMSTAAPLQRGTRTPRAGQGSS